MFEVTGATDLPVRVNAGFWQFFKAGFAFTLGAMVVTFVGGIVFYVFWLSLIVSVLARIR